MNERTETLASEERAYYCSDEDRTVLALADAIEKHRLAVLYRDEALREVEKLEVRLASAKADLERCRASARRHFGSSEPASGVVQVA